MNFHVHLKHSTRNTAVNSGQQVGLSERAEGGKHPYGLVGAKSSK